MDPTREKVLLLILSDLAHLGDVILYARYIIYQWIFVVCQLKNNMYQSDVLGVFSRGKLPVSWMG